MKIKINQHATKIESDHQIGFGILNFKNHLIQLLIWTFFYFVTTLFQTYIGLSKWNNWLFLFLNQWHGKMYIGFPTFYIIIEIKETRQKVLK